MFSNLREKLEPKEAKEAKEAKSGKKKKLKTKYVNSITLDLEKAIINEPKAIINEPKAQYTENAESINNIDLLYLTNQNRLFRPNKMESLVNNNYLLKSIYSNLDENINNFKDEIINTSSSNLKELLENNGYKEGQEKHKLYYLLYVLNLIQNLKEQKIQNLICEDLKAYSNNYNTTSQEQNQNQNQNLDNFNVISETIKFMSSSSSNSKKLTNIDLMVTKKSNTNNKKILPQKWE